MTIGACIITKNEEALLSRCLESLKGIDEIYISDTGSTDKTIEIAKKYTKNIWTEDLWEDNFAKARNFIKSKAKTDWILSIDCDEVLVDYSKVREAVLLAEAAKVVSVNVSMVKEDDEREVFMYPRLFKNTPELFWEGAVHNTLSIVGTDLGDVRIKVGYSPTHQTDPMRALRILKKQMEINPSPRNMFYLGREYWYKREYESCVTLLFQYVQQSYFPAEKADAYLTMARSLWELKRPEEAKDACINAISINPNFKEAIAFMADLIRKETRRPNWESDVRQWEDMTKLSDNKGVLFVRGID